MVFGLNTKDLFCCCDNMGKYVKHSSAYNVEPIILGNVNHQGSGWEEMSVIGAFGGPMVASEEIGE